MFCFRRCRAEMARLLASAAGRRRRRRPLHQKTSPGAESRQTLGQAGRRYQSCEVRFASARSRRGVMSDLPQVCASSCLPGHLGAVLPPLQRQTAPLQILLPCAGWDAPSQSLVAMKIRHQVAGLWEVSRSCGRVLRRLHGRRCKKLHLGAKAGDVLKVLLPLALQALFSHPYMLRGSRSLPPRSCACVCDL